MTRDMGLACSLLVAVAMQNDLLDAPRCDSDKQPHCLDETSHDIHVCMSDDDSDRTDSQQSDEDAVTNATRIPLWQLSVAHHPQVDIIGRQVQLFMGAKLVCGRPAKEKTPSPYDEIFYDKRISREHLSLSAEEGRLRLAVLGQHQVRVGNQVVLPGEAIDLQDGDALRISTKTTPILLVVRKTFIKSPVTAFPEIVGTSAEMMSVKERMMLLAKHDTFVLIRGETGTGKELVAKGLHKASARSSKPFTAVNCAANKGELFLTEIFGHEQGAFTDARKANLGAARRTTGGVLFLDEIGDLELGTQPQLLRFLQEKEIKPLGSSASFKVDLRIIAASHVNFEQAVRAGRLREDFYHRIRREVIQIPPLRDRMDDVPVLARHFVDKRLGPQAKPIDHRLMHALLCHSWPGNVRELQGIMETAIIDATEQLTIGLSPSVITKLAEMKASASSEEAGANTVDLIAPEKRTATEQRSVSNSITEARARKLLNLETIVSHLQANGGNKRKTAEELNIGRQTLYRWLDKLKPQKSS